MAKGEAKLLYPGAGWILRDYVADGRDVRALRLGCVRYSAAFGG
jgi:hypothetical protein